MGAGDRKSRRSVRLDDNADARNFAAAVAKSAQLEAEQGFVSQSQLAHVPSPHRRRDGEPAASEEMAGNADVSPLGGSYRDQLRANGQRALQRSWDGGYACMARPAPAPAAPSGAHCHTDEQYMAMCLQQQGPVPPPPAMTHEMTPSWTTPASGSTGFWPDAGLEMTPAMAMQECQAAQMVPIQSMHMGGSSGPTDGLMAIAMPQCCEMNWVSIAAELRAAAPESYED